MDALRRHATRAAERGGQRRASKREASAKASHASRTPASSRTPSVADVPPVLPSTSIDLTHFRASGTGPHSDASALEGADGGGSGTVTPVSGSDAGSARPSRRSAQ